MKRRTSTPPTTLKISQTPTPFPPHPGTLARTLPALSTETIIKKTLIALLVVHLPDIHVLVFAAVDEPYTR